jgi:hypothetical protein
MRLAIGRGDLQSNVDSEPCLEGGKVGIFHIPEDLSLAGEGFNLRAEKSLYRSDWDQTQNSLNESVGQRFPTGVPWHLPFFSLRWGGSAKCPSMDACLR